MKSATVPTVFIIDDDRGMRQSIQDLVESVGLRAESFATGGEFLKRKPTNDPSCLVLDVRLPQMSGLDFQRELNERNIALPIVFLTGHGDIPMSVRCDEGRRCRISDQAFPRTGAVGCGPGRSRQRPLAAG